MEKEKRKRKKKEKEENKFCRKLIIYVGSSESFDMMMSTACAM